MLLGRVSATHVRFVGSKQHAVVLVGPEMSCSLGHSSYVDEVYEFNSSQCCYTCIDYNLLVLWMLILSKRLCWYRCAK